MSELDLPPELWDVDRLASYLGVGRVFVYRLTRERRIRFVRAGKELRFAPADVAAFLAAEAVQPRPRSVAAPPRQHVLRGRRQMVAVDVPNAATGDMVRVRAPW